MRLRLLNLMYLAATGIVSIWILSDLYSAIVPDGTTGTSWSEGTIAAVFNIPILAGILILLFTFYRYPYGTGNHKRKKQKGGKKDVSTPLILTSKKNRGRGGHPETKKYRMLK